MSIAVFGSINIDVTAYLDRLPRPGETLHGRAYRLGLGGKGANQAVAAARLGSAISLIGRIGTDGFGAAAEAELVSSGLDMAHVRRDPDGQTGIAIINVDETGQNAISVIGGANLALDESDVARGGAVLDGAGVLLLQLEVPLAASLAAARRVRARGGLALLDPAPAPAGGLSREIFAGIDVVTPNETETEALLGWKPASPDDGLRAARALHAMGAAHAVVKLGAMGCCLAGHSGEHVLRPFPVTAIDTVAAGDCFNAGLAHALEQGLAMPEAVRFASACGALSTTKRGAAAAAPAKSEVIALLASAEL